MWYRDIQESNDKVALVRAHFDCDESTAKSLLRHADHAYTQGSVGKPIRLGFDDRNARREYYAEEEPIGELDYRDVGDLVYDAWLEGIQKKDRVTVVLDNQSDGEGTVTAYVTEPYAELWAEGDQTIDGCSWERVGNGEVYAILTDRENLVSDLTSEGYRLELSVYS